MLVAVVIAAFAAGAIGALVGVVAARRSAGSTSLLEAVGIERDHIGDTLRAAVDELVLGVVVGDADGNVVYRNAAAAALAGTHTGVIIEEQVEQALRRARSGERLGEELALRGPPPMCLQVGAEPMPNGFSVVTIEDVSERNRIDAMRTDFVANISHELKTPVGAIAVLAEALLGEQDLEVVDRVASRMVDEAHRAVTSIDDLLELSRLESGQRGDDVIDVREVVDAAIVRGRALDESKRVSVTAFDSDWPLRMRADRRQIESAIGNLVENAVKYSGEDGVVEVHARVDDEAIEVSVVDRGDGIPRRDLDRIFERFYRVDRARSRATGGSGLGLSIVRHVASNHGGEVLVSSVEGEGSTFVLRFPSSLLVVDSTEEPRS